MIEKSILEKVKSFQKDTVYGDCRLRSFSQLTGIYGRRVWEEDLFGLGAGLALRVEEGYYRGVTLPVLVGRSDEAEMIALKKLGYGVEKKEYSPEALKEGKLDPNIAANLEASRPAIFECNVKKLPYIHRSHLGDNTRHVLLLLGHDTKRKEVILLDGLTNVVERLSIEDLIRAHTDKGEDDRKTSWYEISPPIREREPSKAMYRQSFIELGESYRANEEEIDELITCVKLFYERSETESKKNYLRTLVYLNCIYVRRMEEIYGTFYRTFYRKYLENLESKKILKGRRAVENFQRLEDQWKEISFKIRYKDEDIFDSTPDFIRSLETIKAMEYRAIGELALEIEKG